MHTRSPTTHTCAPNQHTQPHKRTHMQPTKQPHTSTQPDTPTTTQAHTHTHASKQPHRHTSTQTHKNARHRIAVQCAALPLPKTWSIFRTRNRDHVEYYFNAELFAVRTTMLPRTLISRVVAFACVFTLSRGEIYTVRCPRQSCLGGVARGRAPEATYV